MDRRLGVVITGTLLILCVARWASVEAFSRGPWLRNSCNSRSTTTPAFSRCRTTVCYRYFLRNTGIQLRAVSNDESTPISTVVVDDVSPDGEKRGQAAYLNDTHDLTPIMLNSAILAAASDSVDSSLVPSDVNNNTGTQPAWISSILTSYWGPRLVLAAIPAIYGTNFALGSLMNDALPASAVTATRMTLATLALAPFVFQIRPSLIRRTVLTGCFTAMGYVAQSVALVDADPARVSFLGAATVVWLPVLESTIDKTPMGWKDAPQTWLAAFLCISGVGVLELYDPVTGVFNVGTGVGLGDVLALLQAVGFGTGVFLTAKMVREEPSQVVPITSVLIFTTMVFSWIWCIAEGSLGPLQELLFASDASVYTPILLALLWTGLVSTSVNFVVEVAALGYVPTSEAAVLLASEPVWAAMFASLLLGETFGLNDYVGGFCIVAACLVNALLKPNDILKLLGQQPNEPSDPPTTTSNR